MRTDHDFWGDGIDVPHTVSDRSGPPDDGPDAEDPQPNELRNKVARLFTGPWRLPVSLSLLALIMMLFGTREYENAITTFPSVPDSGGVHLNLGSVPKNIAITFYMTEENPSYFRMEFQAEVPAQPGSTSPCTPTTIYLHDLRTQTITLSGGTAKVTETESPSVEKPGATSFTTLLAGETCGTDRWFWITGTLRTPLFARNGPALSVHLPGFSVVGQRDAVAAISASWNVHLTDEDVTNIKPEVTSADYKGPGLYWRAAAKPINLTPESAYDSTGTSAVSSQFGTFTSMPAQKAAERSLYWAGLLTGAALSLLTWAGEAAWEVRTKHRTERTAGATEIAELVSARVERLLDIRAIEQAAKERQRRIARRQIGILKRIRLAIQQFRNPGI
ncbi:hypothetical protein FAF44_08945 [Nonomuraea sp. MG754425]|uniref:hypothetical protein n=1 Tax=Nonomuraea sp. MG754425 TaxID=2570319 RepID=UPI001F3759AB|nr:hypothetical protein [Nonomuraea sp. MG754425]MCF6468513.1 hypothetical protein [Nonomuraea sp. MG754425]